METKNSSKQYRNVANKIIDLFKQENKPISHKKLQKLVYLVYAFYYYFNDKKLFDEKFEAWPHGPVCRELYFDIKKESGNNYNAFNISNIKLKVDNENIEDEDQINDTCEYVKKYFGDWSANLLEYLTHKSGSAWSKVINKDNDDWARQHGIGGRSGSPGWALAIYPDERGMMLFQDIQKAEEFIQQEIFIQDNANLS